MAGDHFAGRGWMALVADEPGSCRIPAHGGDVHTGAGPVAAQYRRSCRVAVIMTSGWLAAALVTTITVTVPWHPRPLASPPDR